MARSPVVGSDDAWVDEVERVDWRGTGISWPPVRRVLRADTVGMPAFAAGRPGEVLVEPHLEVGARRLSRVRARGRAVTVIAAAVCAAIVLCVAAVAATPSTLAATPPTASARFVPQSFSAIDDREWWVLGSEPCRRRRCLAIEHTNDGGASFAQTPTPPIRSQGPAVARSARLPTGETASRGARRFG